MEEVESALLESGGDRDDVEGWGAGVFRLDAVGDDGCQIGANHSSTSGWLMMLPAAALLIFRRRSR